MINIKIGDLITHVGSEDTIKLDQQPCETLPTLTKTGLSGEVHLQSINTKTILCTLRTLTANLESVSDISGKLFIRPVSCPETTTRFALDFDEKSDEAWDDVFPIETKNGSIDLEPRLTQCILLQDPVVCCTPEEAVNQQTLPADEDEYAKYA